MNDRLIAKYINKDGKYVLDSSNVTESDNLDEEYNIISINVETLKKMKNHDIDKIIGYQFDENKPIALKLDDDAMTLLYNTAKSEDKSFDETKEIVDNGIKEIFNEIKELEPVNNRGVIFYNINYSKEKTMVMNDDSNKVPSVVPSDIITDINIHDINPKETIDKIKQKVIAQDSTVETLVNNIYNNQVVIESNNSNLLNTSKVNVLLDGPTGTGKTLIIKNIANELNLPMNIVPATIFSAPGYRGADIEDMIIPLLDKTGGNLELAERGIIVLDEFDKLASDDDNSLEMHKAVQYGLLAYLSGTKIPIEYKGKKIEFDTSKITFICLGAFTDLRERKIKEATIEVYLKTHDNVSKEEAIKILEEESKDTTYEQLLLKYGKLLKNDLVNAEAMYTIKPEDYIEEGIIREMVGRFTLLTATQGLGKEALKRILFESEISPLNNIVEVGKLHGKNIIYSEKIVDKIVEKAYNMHTGARALQTVVNGIFNVILSDVIDQTHDVNIEITDEVFEKADNVVKRGESK